MILTLLFICLCYVLSLWCSAHNFNEGDAMDILPQRLRAEIAIHVHLATLKKVNRSKVHAAIAQLRF
jgi:hypothetical protein